MSNALKNVFYAKVKDKFYEYLKAGILRDWGPAFILSVVEEILYSPTAAAEIAGYLQTHNVTIENMNDAADQVAAAILVPKVKNMRVR